MAFCDTLAGPACQLALSSARSSRPSAGHHARSPAGVAKAIFPRFSFRDFMKKIIIYTDGGSRGNPGPAAIGAIFCNEKGQKIKEHSEYLGANLTNNEAEYQAVISALKKFKALYGKKLAKNSEIEVRSDSELLVKQLNGEYKILDEKIQPLFLELWNLRLDFKKLKFKLIPREKNREADRLVNETFDKESRTQKLI